MTRRQLLSDRIHELNKGLEHENDQNDGGEEVVVREEQDEQDMLQHHYPVHNARNRIVFHEDRFTQLIKRNRGTGLRDPPPSKTLSDDEDWQPEGEEDDDDDFYFDEHYDDYDADESTTLRKPASATGHVKKIVNR